LLPIKPQGRGDRSENADTVDVDDARRVRAIPTKKSKEEFILRCLGRCCCIVKDFAAVGRCHRSDVSTTTEDLGDFVRRQNTSAWFRDFDGLE